MSKATPHFYVQEYQAHGNDHLLTQVEFEQAVYPYLGPYRTPDDVEQARAALEKAYKDKGFTAVGISMDILYESLKDANEAWGRVRPFIAKHGVNYPIAMGDDATSKAYSLNAFPATYLIDKSGKIAVAYVGVLINKDNVATNVKSLLSER